jgi:hypothetical protein
MIFISRTIGNSSRRTRKIAKCRISIKVVYRTFRHYKISYRVSAKIAYRTFQHYKISYRVMVWPTNLWTRLQPALRPGIQSGGDLQSPIAIGGPALNASLTMHLRPAVRERVETKWFSHCSSSSLRGSLCGISSSSQNLRSKVLLSHSAMQSDT